MVKCLEIPIILRRLALLMRLSTLKHKKMKVKSRTEILDLFARFGYNVMFGKQYKDMGDYNQIRNINDAIQLFSEFGYEVEYQRVTKNTKNNSKKYTK